jgi:transposase
MSYGLELRKRVVEFVLEGNSIQAANKIFKIHYNTISKWLNRYREEGHLNPKEPYRQAPYKVNWEELEKYVKENPDLTQAEYGKHFGVSQAQICRILKVLDIT